MSAAASRFALGEHLLPSRPQFFGPNPHIGIDAPPLSASPTSLIPSVFPGSPQTASRPMPFAEATSIESLQFVTLQNLLEKVQQDVVELQRPRGEDGTIASMQQVIVQLQQDMVELQQLRAGDGMVAAMQQLIVRLQQDVAELRGPRSGDDHVAEFQQNTNGVPGAALEANDAGQKLVISQLQLDVAELKAMQRNRGQELCARVKEQALEATRISEVQLQDLLARSLRQDEHDASLRSGLAQFEVRLRVHGREIKCAQEAQKQLARRLGEQEVKGDAACATNAENLDQVTELVAFERLARETFQAESHTLIAEEVASRRSMCEDLRTSIDEHGSQAIENYERLARLSKERILREELENGLGKQSSMSSRSISELAPILESEDSDYSKPIVHNQTKELHELHAELQRALNSFNAEVKTWLEARLEKERQSNAVHWDALQQQIEDQEQRVIIACHNQREQEAANAAKTRDKEHATTRASIAAHTSVVNKQIGDLAALVQSKSTSGAGGVPEAKIREMVSQVDSSLRAELARSAFEQCSALRCAVEQLDRKIDEDLRPRSGQAPTEFSEAILREVQERMSRHETIQTVAVQEVSQRLVVTRDLFDDSVRRLWDAVGAPKTQQFQLRGPTRSPSVFSEPPKPWEVQSTLRGERPLTTPRSTSPSREQRPLHWSSARNRSSEPMVAWQSPGSRASVTS